MKLKVKKCIKSELFELSMCGKFNKKKKKIYSKTRRQEAKRLQNSQYNENDKI